MGDIGSADFFKAPEAVTVRTEKAEEMKPHLARFAAKEDDFMAYLKLQRHKDTEMPVIDSVEVVNKTSLPTKLIGAHIDIKPGKKLDLSQREGTLIVFMVLIRLSRVDFRLMKKDKSTGIVFEPLEKSWGPNYFRFGLGMEDSFKGVSKYALTTKFTKTAMNRLAGEWSTEFALAKTQGLLPNFINRLMILSATLLP